MKGRNSTQFSVTNETSSLTCLRSCNGFVGTWCPTSCRVSNNTITIRREGGNRYIVVRIPERRVEFGHAHRRGLTSLESLDNVTDDEAVNLLWFVPTDND